MEILIYLFIFSKYVAELNKRQKIHILYISCFVCFHIHSIVSECVCQHFSLCFIKIFFILCTAFFFIDKYQLICYAIPFSYREILICCYVISEIKIVRTFEMLEHEFKLGCLSSLEFKEEIGTSDKLV